MEMRERNGGSGGEPEKGVRGEDICSAVLENRVF